MLHVLDKGYKDMVSAYKIYPLTYPTYYKDYSIHTISAQ